MTQMDIKQSDNRQTTDTQHTHFSEDRTAHETGTVSGEKNSGVTPEGPADKTGDASIEENLERLAALNLSSAYATRSKFSPTIIRLISAASGIAALLLIYFCFKLFI